MARIVSAPSSLDFIWASMGYNQWFYSLGALAGLLPSISAIFFCNAMFSCSVSLADCAESFAALDVGGTACWLWSCGVWWGGVLVVFGGRPRLAGITDTGCIVNWCRSQYILHTCWCSSTLLAGLPSAPCWCILFIFDSLSLPHCTSRCRYLFCLLGRRPFS